MIDHEMKIFTGNSNRDLAQEICSYLQITLGKASVGTFSDGEILVKLNENVRGKDIFVIQTFSNPVNRNLMELLIMMDALKRASAYRITSSLPYYGYARQDRKAEPRVPITAKLIADLITVSGADRVLTLDLHVGQIQGLFNIPVDNIFATPVILEYLKKMDLKDLVVVSPDAGGVERARAIAKKLDTTLAIIDKRREKANVSEVMNIIGDVGDRDALLMDDMIDTAGTINPGGGGVKKAGARKVLAACTHPVLSGSAIDRLNGSVIDEVIVTNTIPLNGKDQSCKKITTLSVAPLLGEAIRNTHNETSVSSLFL